MKNRGVSLVEVLIGIAIVAIVTLTVYSGIKKEQDFNAGRYDYIITQNLESQGWNDIQVVRRDYRGCVDEDASAWYVNASHPNGARMVDSQVCYEWDDGEVENDD